MFLISALQFLSDHSDIPSFIVTNVYMSPENVHVGQKIIKITISLSKRSVAGLHNPLL